METIVAEDAGRKTLRYRYRYRFACRSCGCVYEREQSETKHEISYSNDVYVGCACPTCGEKAYGELIPYAGEALAHG